MKLLETESHIVLDPFKVSCTTLSDKNRIKRNSIGIEIVPEYYEMVKKELKPVELYFLELKVKYEKTKPERRIAIR